jgi:hypothetical protein
MYRKYLLGFFASVTLAAISYVALGANLVPVLTPQSCDTSNILNCVNTLGQSINQNVTPGSTSFTNSPHNILINGDFSVAQRGTGINPSCGTTGTSGLGNSAYSADMWLCDANVTSGAGKAAISTSGGPLGYPNYLKIYRNSGALTQPICAIQEIPSQDFQDFQGQYLLLSAYIQNLSAAVNGTTVTLAVYYGTGTDEGISTVGMGSSNVLSPAFANVGAIGSPFTTTAAVNGVWTRFYGVPWLVPITATEAAVEICFTPGAEAAGTTDGIGIANVQLEPSQSTTPSAFEARPYETELRKSQRYFYAIPEPTTAIGVGIMGSSTAATTCVTSFPFPVIMRAAPTFFAFGNALSATTWKIAFGSTTAGNALASTWYVTTGANTPNAAFGTWTSSGMTIGQVCYPIGANGGNILGWSADF